MADVYGLDKLPSDILTGAYGDRKLKVSGTFSAGAPTAVEALSTKSFTWNPDGTIDSVIITDTESGNSVFKQFNYVDGQFSTITVTAI